MKLKNPFVDQSALEGDDQPKPSEDEVLMEQAKLNTKVEVVETYMALGMVIGLAAGALLGPLLIGNITTGMGLGMLVGLVAGTCIHKKPKTTEEASAENSEASPKEENKAEESETAPSEKGASDNDEEAPSAESVSEKNNE